LLRQPYAPRPLRFLRLEALDGWRLKLYGISAHGELPRDELVEATLEIAAEALPRPAVTEERYGVGFATAHDAGSASIALVYWWQSENELHQRIYVGPRDDPRAMTQLADQPAGCIWELGIVDFESRAWREDVLANPNGPDLDHYMKRVLSTDF
jgi:hypothetical protein